MQLDTTSSTIRVKAFANGLALMFREQGRGRPILVLHGRKGPQSVASFIDAIAREAYVINPIHPGFAGTPRPDWLNGISGLASLYAELLNQLDLQNVLVVGFSFGAWIAAELAEHDSTRLCGIVQFDDIGSGSYDQTICNATDMWPATVDPQQTAAIAANQRAFAVYQRSRRTQDCDSARGGLSIPTVPVWHVNSRVLESIDSHPLTTSRAEVAGNCDCAGPIEQSAQLLGIVREFSRCRAP